MNDFGSKIYDAAKKAVKEVYDLEPAEGQLIIETPQDTKLGDYSTSIAMKLSRTLRRNPMEIAEPLTAKLAELLPECESITVARPGFINFKLKQSALAAVINDRLELYRAFIDAGAIGVPPACQPAEPADAAASRPGADVLPNAGRADAAASRSTQSSRDAEGSRT